MWMNLYQKTVYEAYKSKERLGYMFFETKNMFIVLWNETQMSYLNAVHCQQFGKAELNFIKEKLPNTFLCIASNQSVDDIALPVKKGTSSYLMMLKAQSPMKENNRFEILRVTDQKTLADFCDVVTDVYDLAKDKDALLRSCSKEIGLDNCFKYVGYVNHQPAGAVEFSEGKDAAYVAWGAVKQPYRKQGLYTAIMARAINYEIDRGLNTIVLNSSETGKSVYKKMGFEFLADRHNYILESCQRQTRIKEITLNDQI